MSPYRRPGEREPRKDEGDTCPDGDLLPVWIVFWLGSIARVGIGISHREAAGSELTLATFSVLAVPFFFKAPAMWWWKRHGRRRRERML